MSGALVLLLLAIAVVIVVAVVVVSSRRSADGVDSFRRQIDALSPEARRPVVDQVQNAAGRAPSDDSDEHDDDADERDDQGGARGT